MTEQPTPEAVEAVADAVHRLGCMSENGLGEPHSDETCGLRHDGDGDHLIAEATLAFIRDAIRRDGDDASAIREALGLRWGWNRSFPKRRVVGEWQEV